MKKLVVGIGVPGAGKTTALKAFAEKYGYSYLCPDDIRKEITGDASDQSRNAEVWNQARNRLAEHLQENNAVVFDATFANHKQRQEFLSFAREHGAEHIEGIYLDVPHEIVRERNLNRERIVPEHAMDRMEQSLREFPPEITDGLDALFTLNAEHALVKAELKRGENEIAREFNKIH